MKAEKVVNIKYLYRWIDDNGVKVGEYKYHPVTKEHTRRYHNCLYLLAGLNSSCRDLMDYLCERMDNNNNVHSNNAVREDFINFIRNITAGEVTYTHPTVKKAYKILSEKGLLIPKDRGTYTVNPEFFFRRSEQERLNEIELILRFKNEGV